MEAIDSSNELKKKKFSEKWEPKILRQYTSEHLLHKLQYSWLFHLTKVRIL
jgi:hypothetical protein